MKKTLYFALSRWLLVPLIVLTATIPPSFASSRPTNVNPLATGRIGFQELIITNINIGPNPYKLSSHRPLVISFQVKNAQVRQAEAFILDSQGAVVTQWTMHLREGVNNAWWKTPVNPGMYTFQMTAPKGAADSKTYRLSFQVV